MKRLVMLLVPLAVVIPSRGCECLAGYTTVDHTPWGQVEQFHCTRWTAFGGPAHRMGG